MDDYHASPSAHHPIYKEFHRPLPLHPPTYLHLHTTTEVS